MKIDYSNKSIDELEKIKLIEEIKQKRAFILFKPEFIGLISVLATIIFGIVSYKKVQNDVNIEEIARLKKEREKLENTIQRLEISNAESEAIAIRMNKEAAEHEFNYIKRTIENEKKQLIKNNKSISKQNMQLANKYLELMQNIESLENEKHIIRNENENLNERKKYLEKIISEHEDDFRINELINNLQIRLKSNIIKIFNFQTSTKVREDKEKLRIEVKSELKPVIEEISTELDNVGNKNLIRDFNKIREQIDIWLNSSRSIRRIYPFYNLNRIKRINENIDKLADEIRK